MAGDSGGLRALVDGPDGAGAGPVPGAGSSGGGGGERLRHSDGPWTRAAGGAEVMRTQLARLGAEFETAHEGVAGSGEGLSAVAVLGSVRTSWERRIEAARDECGTLAGRLRAVARTQGERDAAVRSGLVGLDAVPDVGVDVGPDAVGVGPGAGAGADVGADVGRGVRAGR